MARDVVLAGFLEKGLSRRLAQRMPAPLQRLLFRGGRPLYGVRGAVPAVGALLSALCLAAALLPGAWERLAGRASDGPALDDYARLGGHMGMVTSVAFSPDGQRVLTTANDGTARVWAADGSRDPVMLRITPTGTNPAAFSPDGQWIVTASRDEAVQLWRADGGTPRMLRRPTNNTWPVTIAAFSPDGEWFLTGFQDNAVEVWRTDGSKEPVLLRHDARVNSAAFSPNGQRIVTTASNGTVWLWRADGWDNEMVLQVGPVSRASFSPDGQRILTVGDDSAARVWPANGSGTPVTLRHPGLVSTAVFSPDEERIATTSTADGAVRVWPADSSGTPLVLRGHTDPAYVAAFSPDGRHIVTTSSDGPARLFRADGSAGSIVLRGHTSPVPAGAISPDGQRIAIGYIDGMVRLWGRAPGIPVNIIGCSASPPLYAVARRMADSLARDTLFSPAVYAPSAWDSVRLGAPPRPGEVRYAVGDARSRALADTVVARLGRTPAGPGRLPFRAVGAAVPAGALSIGVCQRGAIPADSIVQVSVYYKAAGDSPVAGQVAQTLADAGYRIGIVAHRPNAANTGAENIRYFRSADLAVAQAVQGVVREALAAAGAGGFQPRLEDRSRSGAAASVDRVEVWLPALDSWRVPVRIQVHSRETDRDTVLAALRGLRFPVTLGPPNPGVPLEMRTNAIWYGTGVPLEDVKLVAAALMHSGVQIRLISPFVPQRMDRRDMIQVGSLREAERYGSTTLRARPYSAEEIRTATTFPIP
jgi:WD40 repeat protein